MKNALLLLTFVVAASAVTPRVAFGQGCYDSSIISPTPFMGNNGEMFRLADGSIWEVKYEYEYLYEYYPKVTICPTRGILIVRGKALTVQWVARTSRPSSPQPQTELAQPDSSPQLAIVRDDDFSFYDSRGRATSLFVHLAMCRYCRAYARSLRLIGETARRFYASTPAEGKRLEATLSAVQEAIHQAPAE